MMCYKKGVQKSKRMVCVVLGAALLWSGCNPLMVLEYGSRAVGTMVENLVSAYRAERDLFEGYIRELAGVKPVPAGHTLEEVTLQNPELPNGCEVTSLSMLLAAFGLPIDKVELYERYMQSEGFADSQLGDMRYGPSPEEVYVGDAASASGGWYCFEGPVVKAGAAWLAETGSDYEMQIISGLSREELDQYAQRGTPVVAWVTLGYQSPSYPSTFRWMLPDGTVYVPYSNLHCVVLAGEEGGQYRIADPLYGWTTVEKEVFWESFDAMGRRAVSMR